MKKLFSSFLALGTVASFAACGKQEAKAEASEDTTKTDSTETTDAPKSTVQKGTVLTGTYKIGYTGEDVSQSEKGKEIGDVVKSYTQDILNPATTGDNFYKLPSGLILNSSSDKWSLDDADGSKIKDETELAAQNLDSLFIQVKDEKHNSSDVYKNVVEKKAFGDTHVYFIGKKAESQDGASSKKFAGDKVSTATFNEYASAYTGGFQAAVGAIKYSGSEDTYEETDITFFIGSIAESDAKKKAFAFRRGVEAAAAHPEYSKYLKVKFVNKTEDNGSTKKLYRDISDWKRKDGDDKKPKLYEFTSSETFTDADKRVMYIAGSTAEDWRGKAATAADDNTFNVGDDTGLIGAIFKYSKIESSNSQPENLKNKSYSRGILVILDKVSGDAGSSTTAPASLADQDTAAADAKHFLTYDADSNNAGGLVSFERHGAEIKFYGALGIEKEGTSSYVKSALKGQYMGGPNYMIGKHTIFGAPLDLSQVTDTTGEYDPEDTFNSGTGTPAVKSVWRNAGNNDSGAKAKARFSKSFSRATEKELVEEEITKEASWIR